MEVLNSVLLPVQVSSLPRVAILLLFCHGFFFNTLWDNLLNLHTVCTPVYTPKHFDFHWNSSWYSAPVGILFLCILFNINFRGRFSWLNDQTKILQLLNFSKLEGLEKELDVWPSCGKRNRKRINHCNLLGTASIYPLRVNHFRSPYRECPCPELAGHSLRVT